MTVFQKLASNCDMTMTKQELPVSQLNFCDDILVFYFDNRMLNKNRFTLAYYFPFL